MVRIFLLVLVCSHYGFAGFPSYAAGGRHGALGGADIARTGSVWSLTFGPAGLNDLGGLTCSAALSPEPFGMKELSTVSFVIAGPGLFGVVGIGASRFGFDLFRQVTLTACYAGTLVGVDFGFGFNYYSFSIARYGSAGTCGIDMGVRVPVSPYLAIAINGENINSPVIGMTADELPQAFSLGAACSPVDVFSAELDYRKEEKFPGTPSMGVEYRPVPFFTLRMGVVQTPTVVTAGFGISWSFVEIDYAYSAQNELGGTQQVSLTVHRGR